MIVKIITRKRPDFKHLLNYMMSKKDMLFDPNERSFVITHNLIGNDINRWEKQFIENEKHRLRKRKDSVYINHEILSWHKDDAKNLTLAKMEEMAGEYIRQRNPKGIYVAVPHFDKDHFHIHICASGIEYKTGKSLRLSKTNLSKLKKGIQQYQIEKFPELSKSVVAHGKKDKTKLSDKEYQVKFRQGRDSEKEKVIGILNICFKKAKSIESFCKLLGESGLKTYERSGKTTGVVFKNYKFRFSRLGFTEERFLNLIKTLMRERGLKELRNKESKKQLQR